MKHSRAMPASAPPKPAIDPELLIRMRPAIWLETYGYIRNTSGKKHRPRVNVLQRRIEAAYCHALKAQRPLRTIGLKPRKRGYSTMVGAIHHSQLNNWQHEGVIIGNKLDTSDTVYRMMVYFAQTDEFKGHWGSPYTATSERLTYEHGARVMQDTAKNGESIRGMTPQFIHGTEMAYWDNGDEVLVALLNAVPDTGFNAVFLESTPNGASGAFYDTWQQARWPTDAECPSGQKGYWRQWEALSPNQEKQAGGLGAFDYVRIFAAWYEFDDAAIKLNAEEKREIEQSLDAASWYAGEKQLIEVYGNMGPQGQRLGLEVTECDVWEQLAWRRMVIKGKCKGNPRIFDVEYPRDPKSCFLASGNPVFDEDALAHLQVMARQPAQAGHLTAVETTKGQPTRATWINGSSDGSNFWKWEAPKVGCSYLLIVDPAEGEDQTKGDDPDCHSVLLLRRAYVDAATGVQHRIKLVARVRPPNRMPLYSLAQLIHALWLYYGQPTFIPEMNNSGLALIMATRALGIPVWQRKELDPHSGRETRRDGWRTTDTKEYGGIRAAIIWHLHAVLREKAIDCPCPHVISELAKFVDKAGRMEAANGHDDDVMALAIGVFNIDSAKVFSEPKVAARLPADLRELEHSGRQQYTGMAQEW